MSTQWLKQMARVFRSWQTTGTERNRRSRPERLAAGDLLESRLLLTTAAIGEQFLVSEVFGVETTAPSVVVHGNGNFTAAWASFE